MLDRFTATVSNVTLRMTPTTSMAWVTFEQGKMTDHTAALELLVELGLEPYTTRNSRSPYVLFTQYTVEFPTDKIREFRYNIACFN
tara:strand:+ start:1991 stop:2248 length:258 start_codon:yes stop_codon:yes gene_type:complete